MYIERDLFTEFPRNTTLESVLVWGARQVGKTTSLERLPLASSAFLDDLSQRQRAQSDPEFFLDHLTTPCLIDEVQYAPNLFPAIKGRIDALRRAQLKQGHPKSRAPLYYLTGSNPGLLENEVKESLAGRCHLVTAHGLSLRELQRALPDLTLPKVLFTGGLPELYTREGLSPVAYLNDYILSFVERDIARGAGIEKRDAFLTVLRLLAARSGQFLNMAEVAGAAGIDPKTVESWVGLLRRNFILDLLSPFASNLSKRITRMKKLHFLDTGLCARLQGHSSEDLLWNSPQAGALFESLVYSEILKTRDHHERAWTLHTWRTKDKNEIDFIVEQGARRIFIEAKFGIHAANPVKLDTEALRIFTAPHLKWIVTAGGTATPLDRETQRVPIWKLGDALLQELG